MIAAGAQLRKLREKLRTACRDGRWRVGQVQHVPQRPPIRDSKGPVGGHHHIGRNPGAFPVPIASATRRLIVVFQLPSQGATDLPNWLICAGQIGEKEPGKPCTPGVLQLSTG